MKADWKDRFAERSADYPVINSLVRLLLFSFWFRLATFGCAAIGLLLVFSMLKIWRVTPEGHPIAVRISVVDWAQARALARTAEKAIKAGEVGDALISLQAAIANNPGDRFLMRRFLALMNASQADAIERASDPRLQIAFWLNQLSPRHPPDKELVAATLERMGMDQELLAMLGTSWTDFSDAMAVAYLKALFNLGAIERFKDAWEALQGAKRFGNDSEMALYQAAVEAIERPSDAVARPGGAGLQLERSAEGPAQNTVLRLRLTVFERNSLHELYQETLGQLAQRGSDRIVDHVKGWRMLLMASQQPGGSIRLRDQALAKARQFSGEPKTQRDAELLCAAWIELGLVDRAEAMLETATVSFGSSEALWNMKIWILADKKAWVELRSLALALRLDRGHPRRPRALSHIADGRAYLGHKRGDLAATEFQAAAAEGIASFPVAVDIARDLTRLGHPGPALAILSSHKTAGANSIPYCEVWVAASFELRGSASLLQATDSALRLQPDNWAHRNNRAAAFCLVRTNAAAAVALTMSLIQAHANTPAVLLNHAMALGLNRRWEEAELAFESLPLSSLTPAEKSACHFGWIEALIHLGQLDRARTLRPQVDASFLFSEQRLVLREFDGVLAK